MRGHCNPSTAGLYWAASIRNFIFQNMPCVATAARITFFAILASLALNHPAAAQWIGKQTGCIKDEIVANPNRPTVSNPAHITQYGVLELEYGWDRTWPEPGTTQTSVGGLLKFGMLCDIELRWNNTAFLSQTDDRGTHRTFGDNWLGAEIRFHKQTNRLPTLAFSYSVKIPSATRAVGLGSGYVDHSLTLGMSDTVKGFNVDFNVTGFFLGRSKPGFDNGQQLALAVSHRIWRGLQFAGEFYGQTEIEPDTTAFASSLWALTYTIRPRLVIDGGFEAGLSSGGPHRHVFIGVTYSIANLYRKRR